MVVLHPLRDSLAVVVDHNALLFGLAADEDTEPTILVDLPEDHADAARDRQSQRDDSPRLVFFVRPPLALLGVGLIQIGVLRFRAGVLEEIEERRHVHLILDDCQHQPREGQQGYEVVVKAPAIKGGLERLLDF